MSDYGVKISLPGSNYDGDLNQLLFHSSYPLLKIHSSGGGTHNYTAGHMDDILITTHDLAYNPMFFFYSQYFDDFGDAFIYQFKLMPYAFSSSTGLIRNLYIPYIDGTELRFYLETGGAGEGGTDDIDYYWFIFHDEK